MLTGNQLIKTIKENTEVSKCDIVKLCGYTSVRKNGCKSNWKNHI